MSNKIDSISQQLPVSRQDNRAGAADSAKPGATNAPAGGGAGADTVELTNMAQRLQALEASVAELPEVDPGRVAAMREQIASGEYSVDARSVADKMIGLERQLPGTR